VIIKKIERCALVGVITNKLNNVDKLLLIAPIGAKIKN
jgi:hypothetical protein